VRYKHPARSLSRPAPTPRSKPQAWQWTADCWRQSYVGAPGDGSAWSEPDCSKRTIRGGSWSSLPVFVRSAARSGSDRGDKDTDYSSLTGFRVARDLP